MGTRRLQIRKDTTANWTAANPVLASGEFGFDTTTKQFKVGDGATAWTTLNWYGTATFEIINPTNLLSGGNFEVWSAGDSSLPDGWTYLDGSIAKESTIVKIGSYSTKLWKVGDTGGMGQQNVHTSSGKGLAYFKNRIFTYSCWVWCDTAGKANIVLQDGVANYYSSHHTGSSSWELLSVTATIGSGATLVQVGCAVLVGAPPNAYFDGAMLVEGDKVWSFADQPAVCLPSVPASTGVGSVKMGTGNVANNAGWLKVKKDDGVWAYVPYWTTPSP
jgi:hypothetical protein